MTRSTRVEHDSMGELEVPASALWGAQTQRAVQNFPPSGLTMPRAFIRALGLIKHAAAAANAEFGDLPIETAAAIQAAALEVAAGRHDDQFPVDVFQTGSGTSSNMNANEVIATLASRSLGQRVHANDQVNMGQSSNDVVPTAVPPCASARKRGSTDCRRARPASSCAAQPPSSWPTVIGIASIKCVRPVLTTPPNSAARMCSVSRK